MAPRFPIASWGWPSPAGEGGTHWLLGSLERKGLGWDWGCALTSFVTHLTSLDVGFLLLKEFWGVN